VNDAVAYRRRVWFGVIVVTASVLLGVAALLPNRTPPSLRVEQASADETLPPADSTSTTAPSPAPAVAAPTTSTTAPTTTTTTSKRAATTTTAPVKATAAPAPVVTPVAAPSPSPDAATFLACVRQRESHGDYRAVSPDGTYRGAYQFTQSAWDSTARHAGRPDLVGVPPDQASPADQDAMALDLYTWQGAKPWGGSCS